MPRTKKEVESVEKEKKSTSSVKKAAAKKSSISAKKTSTKTTSKKSVAKSTNKVSDSINKKTTSKESSAKKTSTTKAKTTKKSTVVSKTRRTKKTPVVPMTRRTKKSVTESKDKFINVLEYYDLPYRYNETIVKILAQTPKILFVYWEISDEDRKKYIEKYGEYVFNDTYPVLIVHNKTLNYTEEVEINDFANSWYISIPDSRSEYTVELGRRFKEYAKRNPDMPHKEDVENVISVAYSNNLIMPNDHVLLDEIKPQVKYRNVKTNAETYKSVSQILQYNKNNKLVDFYSLYREIYQVGDLTELSDFFSLTNPSSGNPTSTFK